jgi:hypothetical protein
LGFVAIPVCLGLTSLRRSIPGRRGVAAAAVALGVLVAALGVVNYRWYSNDYAARRCFGKRAVAAP